MPLRTAATDDDRSAAQLRPVALLDGSEERVQVHVGDDPRRLGHRANDAPPRGVTAVVTRDRRGPAGA